MDLEEGCGAMKITTSSYWRPSGKNIHRRHDASEKSDWGVSPDEGYKVLPSGDEQTRWRVWRAQRDLVPSAAKDNIIQNGEAKNGKEPFVDRPLQKAVEYLEKEAGEKT